MTSSQAGRQPPYGLSSDDLPQDAWRRGNPRFQDEALRENLRLADTVTELARERGITPGQLAVA